MQGRELSTRKTMISKGDKVYTFDTHGIIAFPVEGTVIDVSPSAGQMGTYDVNVKLYLKWDDGFITVMVPGKYTPGATRTEGGSEYVEIDHSDSRVNCYLYPDRIFNLQLCVQQSALHVSNAKHFCKELLEELRSLGQEPPVEVMEMMKGFGLE